MRMFVAVMPPEPVLEDLEEFLGPRREAAPFRWSGPEQWHVTLAFMGHVPDRSYDDLVDRLGHAAGRRRPIEVRLAGGGAFPHAAAARVLWVGVDARREGDADELAAMARGARSAAVTAGVEVDGQRFRPHVTLARTGRPLEVTRWVHLLETYDGASWTVDELALVASHLGEGPRGRPRYETVATFSLGRAGSGPG